jgi:hypothetical protein
MCVRESPFAHPLCRVAAAMALVVTTSYVPADGCRSRRTRWRAGSRTTKSMASQQAIPA